MKNTVFMDIMHGIEMSNSIIKGIIEDRNFDMLDDDQLDKMKGEIDEIVNNIEQLSVKSMDKHVRFEVWDIDVVKGELFNSVMKNDEPRWVTRDIEVARKVAKESALGWCNDKSELHREFYQAGTELWIGDSDCGTIIKKVKD